MMKKTICFALIIALSLFLPPAPAHANNFSEDFNQTANATSFVQPLSEMSESECIEFIKSYGVEIPSI